jgi:hypothetical protein
LERTVSTGNGSSKAAGMVNLSLPKLPNQRSGYPPRLHPDDKRSQYKTKKNRKCDRNENLTVDIKCCNDKGGYGQIDQGRATPLSQFYLSRHVQQIAHPTIFVESERGKPTK